MKFYNAKSSCGEHNTFYGRKKSWNFINLVDVFHKMTAGISSWSYTCIFVNEKIYFKIEEREKQKEKEKERADCPLTRGITSIGLLSR